MTMPPGPLKYGSSNTVSCSSIDDLGTSPTWTLQQPGVVNKICTGTQAIVTAVSKTTSVYLNSITELWKGKLHCSTDDGEQAWALRDTIYCMAL